MSLEAMLAQYEKNTQPIASGSKEKTDLKNYFTTYLPDGVNSKMKRVRILPPTKAGETPFVQVQVHSIQLPDGQWRKFICPKHEQNVACPFCETREALYASGTDTDRELAKKYSPKMMYVVKVIDREFEDEGPKFWRFNHDYRGTGIYDKVQGVLQAVRHDISDATDGRDLFITIGRDQNKRPVVQSIVQHDKSPLSENAEQAKTWLADTKTWEDVYKIYPYEYLEIIVKGGVPVYDKDSKKYIDKSSITEPVDGTDDELTVGGAKPTVSAPVASPKNAELPADEDEDDLPF